MKKIVVFGGGTGLSCLLSGLKLFPVDVTTVIAVSDNGSSTGVLKKELDIPAVGDVGKVLISMANVDEDFTRLLRYRFSRDGSLYNHPVRNIMLAALIDLKGSLTEATRYMCSLLKVKGTVLPLTEEKVELVGENAAVVDNPSSKGTGNETDLEQLLLWDPEFIIFSYDSVGAEVADDPLWQQLTAIREGNYAIAPFGPYNWMGFPPSVQRYPGILWLLQTLYPEQADYDLYSEVNRFFELFYHCTLTPEQYEKIVG